MADRTVLISGASVAGPALAFWLRRHGFAPTVIERAPAPRGGGYDVDFRGSAVIDVLDRMGILDEVRRQQTPRRETVILDGDGRQATLPPEKFGGDIEIQKSDLTRILHAATESDVPYIFDNSIIALTQRPDSVRVTFERGESRDFDLVVGSDGQHSIVRALAFGPESDFIHHLGMASAGFTTANYLGLANRGLLYQVSGAFADVNCRADKPDMHVVLSFAAESLDYDRNDVEQQKEIVADRLAGLGWEVPRLLTAMRAAPDLYFDTMSQIKMTRWTDGRVALLGDAACCAAPTSGLGTSQALIGAYVLAGELAATAGHESAFAGYEQQMRPYVAETQRIGAQGAHWYLHPDEAPETDQEPAPASIKLKNH